MTDAINMFYTAIKSFFDSCAPMYYPSISKPPWFNKELTHLRNVKSRLYIKFKNTSSQSILCKYLSARLNFTVLNAQCYKNYLNRCKFQFAQNPKQFYNFVSTKRKTSSYPSSLFFENTTVTSDQAIADLFAKFFQTTYSTLPHSEQPYQKHSMIHVLYTSPLLITVVVETHLTVFGSLVLHFQNYFRQNAVYFDLSLIVLNRCW